jgi:Kdo2-lipid IVA lauroyltransferase/acyltransferase
LKWLFFKLAFLYPRIYAFFCYYRKKEQRTEFEDKVRLFFDPDAGPDKVKRAVRGIFEIRGSRKMQRYLLPRLDQKVVRQFVTIEGLHHLDQALQQGRGILMIAGHIGNPHIGLNIVRVLGYDLTIIKGGKTKIPRFPKFRYSDPLEFTIFTEDTSLSKTARERALEILRSPGRILYYSGDAIEGKRKVEIPFLRHRMWFATGTLHLAAQANAIVLPIIHLYRHGKIFVGLGEPLDDHWKNGSDDYPRILENFAKLLEAYILPHPEEYMGMYGHTVLNDCYRAHQGKSDEAAEGET